MPDFDAINSALAARFAAAQVTPPTGYDNVKISTGDLPTGLLPTPCVLVFPHSGDADHNMHASSRHSVHNFRVVFYYNQAGDIERDYAALRKWLTVLFDQLKGAVQLGGLTGVSDVHVLTWTVGFLKYAQNDYTGIELGVSLVYDEPWAVVA